jgi:hypothetical protein
MLLLKLDALQRLFLGLLALTLETLLTLLVWVLALQLTSALETYLVLGVQSNRLPMRVC